VLTEPTPAAFAAGLTTLVDDPERRQGLGGAARRFVVAERSRAAFERRLMDGLRQLGLP